MIFMISRSNHPMSKSIWYRLCIFPKEIVSLHKNLTVNSVLIQTITCYCETTLSRPSVFYMFTVRQLWSNCMLLSRHRSHSAGWQMYSHSLLQTAVLLQTITMLFRSINGQIFLCSLPALLSGYLACQPRDHNYQDNLWSYFLLSFVCGEN